MKVLNVNKLHREKVKTNNQTNGNRRDVGKLVEKFLSCIPTAEMSRLRITKLNKIKATILITNRDFSLFVVSITFVEQALRTLGHNE